MQTWGPKLPPADRLEQFKLIYDYIKFHMGLYLATPPVLAILADGFDVPDSSWFKIGLGAMILVYLASGIHAGLFMGQCVNEPWDEGFLNKIEKAIFSPFRRLMHHTLYWIGLGFGLVGLAIAIFKDCKLFVG